MMRMDTISSGMESDVHFEKADRADHPTRTVSDAVLPPQIKSARTELVGGSRNESAKY